MAFYSTQCQACADTSKRCVKTVPGADGQALEMYECGNEECKLNAARLKGIRQLQSLKAGEQLNQERESAKRSERPERKEPTRFVYRSKRDRRR